MKDTAPTISVGTSVQLVLIILKLCGILKASWWVILLPLEFWVAILLLALLWAICFHV